MASAGKEVLVKAVAQAIPVFSISCFKLPRGLCENLNMMIRKFWRGSNNGQRKPHWMSWKEMTQPKAMGGLGFKDFELFNLALLTRQAWRVLVEDESLSAQILKAAYYPNCSLLDATLGPHPSHIWRAILDGRDVLAQGVIRRIGDGETTSVWDHNWIPRPSFKRPITSLVPAPPKRVAELIDETTAT